jgi:hypothetical protein
MSESALSLGYTDLAAMVARSGLGIKGSSDDWTAQETTDIQRSVDKGYSDFLRAHDWRFLKKFTTLTTTEPYSTGTITLTEDDATVTLADGTWPSWAVQGSLYYNGHEYSIASRTDNTNIELDAAWGDDTASGVSYELRRVGYDLPDDFGQPDSWFTYDASHARKPLNRVAANRLLAMRSGCTTSGYPRVAAIRAKTGDFDNTDGQRFEVLLHPLADAAYTLGYSYCILAENALRDSTEYPLGGQVHAQAILDCCIAAARYLFQDMPLKEYKEAIREAISDSILKDEQLAPTDLGYNADRSDRGFTHWRDDNNRFVTVNGVLPD